GRAEDLLNKIDQNAATVLNDNGKLSDNHYSLRNAGEKRCKYIGEDIQYNEKINTLEYEIQNLNKQLLNIQHLCAELRNENINLQSQVETANYLVATAQSEMEQYKARAQRILQEKEDLIALKNKSKSPENSDYIMTNYNDELRKEIEFQQNKNIQLLDKLKKLTQENSFLQQQIVLTQNASQQSSQSLQENLISEKKFRMIAEEECRIKSHDLHSKMQELAQQYHIIQLKNEEINSLQDALKRKANINVNNDFEMQIKSLTDTLMLKQNALETITTERNALRLQLEKLENEYHTNLAHLERAQVRVISINDTDDVKSQVPHFMRVSPFDAGVTRKVKHAYSTVDAISVKTGIFLRRYPIARVFSCIFGLLLYYFFMHQVVDNSSH
ncbi:golgin-84, partial [Asbolus verrucosus]